MSHPRSGTAALRADERLTTIVAPALLAMLLGSFLLFGAGFAHIDALHNAAHDSRHSFAFPCH
jgi:cobalt transporter subunit CbtB